MASILTNTGAMTALQTMRNINRGMETVQNQISTGLKVGSAKDNSATWAISKVMESDVAGFKSIKESLALGSSTVNVARNAAETTVSLLTEIKEKVVLAQEENVDREKIQADIVQLRDQIASVVSSAQFNGLNLVNGSEDGDVSILSSLDRSAGGVVQNGQITVDLSNTNLSRTAGTTVGGAAVPATPADAVVGTPSTIAATGFVFSNAAAADGTVALRRDQLTDPNDGGHNDRLIAGDTVEMTLTLDEGQDITVSYTVRAGDTGAAINTGLRDALIASGLPSDLSVDTDADGALVVTNNRPTGGDNIEIGFTATRGAGGLSALTGLDVAGDDDDRAAALRDIESMIGFAIDASATFGQAQKRIEIQNDFVSGLMDTLRTGIGALVDADMEEASARLQALQVQQQLGIQSLSIANQQPQNILSLFR